jgi:hypothetical protein
MLRRSFLAAALQAGSRQTELAIDGERFLINNKPTYPGREWRGHKIEGLLCRAAIRAVMRGSSSG